MAIGDLHSNSDDDPKADVPNEEVEFPQSAIKIDGAELTSKQISQIIEGEQRQGRRAFFVGAAIILLGAILLILGVSGNSGWVFKIVGVNSTLTNASPGVILFIIGVLIILLNKSSFDISNKRKTR